MLLSTMNANRFFHDYAVLRTIAATNRCFRARPSFCGYTTCLGSCGGGASTWTLRRRFLSNNSSAAGGRFSSSSSSNLTPSLRGPEGAMSSLLQGLDIHTVLAEDDGHPLTVYTIQQHDNDSDNNNKDHGRSVIDSSRIPVLLLHGRTWSSLPVYHLIGEANKGGPVGSYIRGEEEADDEVGKKENRSLLQALYNNNNNNIEPYAMDFRGFGGTPRSCGGLLEPLRCVADAVSVLNWIRDRHQKHYQMGEGEEGVATIASKGRDVISRPALLGWSHGALIAQITAQRHPELVSKLILYGSIYNRHVTNITSTVGSTSGGGGGHTDHDDFPLHEMAKRNEYDGAMEDFTSIGSTTASRNNNNNNNNNNDNGDEARIFPPVSARLFAEAALLCDPVKVQWKNLHQLNECQPSLVKVSTLVIAGDQDPFAPMSTQADLFTSLGRGGDKMWTIIANADHAVHLSDERHRFVENVSNFLKPTTT